MTKTESIIEYTVGRGAAGACSDEICAALGYEPRNAKLQCSELLRQSVIRGRLVWVHEPSKTSYKRWRFFAKEFAPEVHGEASMQPPKVKTQPKKPTLDAAAPVTGELPKPIISAHRPPDHKFYTTTAPRVVNAAECSAWANAAVGWV